MNTTKNKIAFEVKVDDVDLKLAVLRPSVRVNTKAGLVYSKAIREATEAGVPLQSTLEKRLLDQIWDADKQFEFNELVKKLIDGEAKLAAGGNANLTKKQAANLAIEMRIARQRLQFLTIERNRLYTNTAEAFAEQAKFNYLVSECTVYADTGAKYFSSVDEYLDSYEEDPVGPRAAAELMTLLYPVDIEAQKELPENKFLLKYGFANDNLRLINDKKQLVDVDFKPVNERGDWIDEQGNPIDAEGKPLTETGEYKIEFAEFLDDDDVVISKQDSSNSAASGTENQGDDAGVAPVYGQVAELASA